MVLSRIVMDWGPRWLATGAGGGRPGSGEAIAVARDDYGSIRASLLASYGEDGARRRARQVREPWKLAERDAFLRRMEHQGCRDLLDVGAGTGQDSMFFAQHGLNVVVTDLSSAMVAICSAKGLNALVMDFASPSLVAESFDAVHAMNCLLHVPNAALPRVMAAIRALLRPGGLFFLGVYGVSGRDGWEGPLADDDHVPPRFFSWRTDAQIRHFAAEHFEIVDFHVVPREEGHRFQSLTLRREAARPAYGPKRPAPDS
jgi:SAM-dependent methyltransferase